MDSNQDLRISELKAISMIVLDRILVSRSRSDFDEILEDPEIKAYRMNTDRYHQLNLTISKEQLQDCLSSGFIQKDGSINEKMIGQESAATRLLYAFLWKQGDLQKIRYIVQGITGHESVPESGLVLYYFGKHLADKKNPIIDQHVIRAFSLAYDRQNFNEGNLSKKYIDNIHAYIHWFQHILPAEIRSSEECRYMVDQVLYALGKRIKSDLAWKFRQS